MELSLNDDQQLFHETTVRFIETELPVDSVRRLAEDSIGFDRTWWQKSAELGWFALLVPEADGGGSVSGSGLVDASIVAEELGRHVQPGPFVPANVVASAIATCGSEEQRRELLPDIISGLSIPSWAFSSEAGEWDAGAGVNASRSAEGFVLDGTRGFVQDAVGADLFLIVAELEGRPVQFLVPSKTDGLVLRHLSSLDLSRRLSRIELSGVKVPSETLIGPADATQELQRQLDLAVALNCAETVGTMDALFSMTVSYSKDRIAFGRPIGSFQALKHIMADEALHLETSKAGAVAAIRAVQASDEFAGAIVSMAAAYIGDVSDQLAQMALQIHGGIGYTWEHDLHLYLRRIRSNAALYGESTWHRERVCHLYGLGEEP